MEALRLRVKRKAMPSTRIESNGTVMHYVLWPDVVTAWAPLFTEEA